MQTAIEETYEDVESLIHHLTHRFMGRKGISEYDYEEWHGVWSTLASKLRSDAPHWKTLHYEQSRLEEIVDESCDTKIQNFILSLSDDANTVVRLVLGAGSCVDGKESDPGEIRVGLYLLLTNFGWSFRRIVETFYEIKTALLD